MFGGGSNEVVILVKSKDETSRGFASAEKRSRGFSSAIGSMAKGAALGLAGVGVASVGMGIKFVKAAEDSIKVSRQTQAVIKSTGGVARVSAKDVDTLATALSKKTGIDDEAIASGENMLLTFTNVRNEVGAGNDIFTQATKVALDFAVATGKDATQANLQLGKALNDPVKGMTALSRSGVQFTDQQKEQIKTLVESGNRLEAQKIILAEMTKEFGGSAEAQATASGKMEVAWDNAKEALGTALMPLMVEFANFVTDRVTPAIENYLVPAINNGLIPALHGIKDVMDTYVLPPLREFSDWLRNTAGPAIGDFANTAKDKTKEAFQSINDDYDNHQSFAENVWHYVQDRAANATIWIRGHWEALFSYLHDIWDEAKLRWAEFTATLKEKWNTAVNWLRNKWDEWGISEKLHILSVVAGVVFEPFISGAKKAIGWIASFIGWVERAGEKLAELLGKIPSLSDIPGASATVDPKHLAKSLGGHAAGGPTSGPSWMHERGPEIARLPDGSMVIPAGQSAAMLNGGGGAVVVRIDLSGGDSAFMEWLRERIWVEQGGDVQAALGRS